jgi:UDP-N-acetylmuramate dehydrogenase
MMTAPLCQEIIPSLPEIRGKYRAGLALSDLTWFRVGGAADVLFSPADEDDLQHFLKNCPSDIPVTVLGAGSNTLVRDKGVSGVVIKLGKAFADVTVAMRDGDAVVIAGAAALDVAVSRLAAKHSLSGLEFFRGIPGSIGGALRMNAGAYGGETADVFDHAIGYDLQGQRLEFTSADMGFAYRHCGLPEDVIFTSAQFKTSAGDAAVIQSRMDEISRSRETSQPIRSRTGGSTFRNPGGANPDGPKAWKLIDAAGCRGLWQGDAQVSEQHCNFLINHGQATATDLETLGETVRRKVLETGGVELHWEIKRIGEAA